MEDIKKQLIEQAKQLLENFDETDNVYKAVSELRKQWKTCHDDELSFYEKELQDTFDDYLNKIYAKINANQENNEAVKNEIIAKAQELVNSDNFKKNSPIMKELMDKWKNSGPVAKEKQDELWLAFNTLREQFYNKRNDYYANLDKLRLENEQNKKSIIEKAIEANKMTDIKELTKTMNDLMTEWKACKSAGKEKDEELWAQFSKQRQDFFDKKNSFYESMKQTYEERCEKKKEIIAKAKHCLAMSEFTKEEIETMNNLIAEYKKIGSAGKDNENELWLQFSNIVNRYNENKKYYL